MSYKNMYTLIVYMLLVLVSSAVQAQSWQSTSGPTRGAINIKELIVGRAPGDANATIYAVDGAVLNKSTNGGLTWGTGSAFFSGADNPVLTCKPSTPTYAIGAINGTIFISSNGGSGWDWSNIHDDQCIVPLSAATSGSYSGQDLMFIGLKKYAVHVSMLRSLDGGIHWGDVSSFFGAIQTDVTVITTHPTDGNIAFAGGKISSGTGCGGIQEPFEEDAIYENGVFFTTDAGENWYSSGNLGADVKALATYYKSSTSTTYTFAVTSANTVYKSANSTGTGATWTSVTSPSGTINQLNVVINGSTAELYAATSNGLYKSTNDGSNWTQQYNNILDPSNMKRVAIDPQNLSIVFAGNSTSLYKSTNAGSSWSDIGPTTVSLSATSIGVKGSTILAAQTDYKVLYRKLSGESWSWLALETPASNFKGTKVGFVSASSSNAFAAGYRDQGSGNTTTALWKSTNDGSTWTEVIFPRFAGHRDKIVY